MNVSAPFIARPIATALLAIAVLISGILGYMELPVSSLPEVEFPTIEVTTQLPGAGPNTIASLITAPLERQLGEIQGVVGMTSTSAQGLSQIIMQFSLDRDIDDAAQDVQAAINASAGTLPTSLPYPPVYAKVNPADTPIVTLAMTSKSIPLYTMADEAVTLLQPKLSQINGIGQVTVLGGLRQAYRIQADPARLAAYSLSLEDIRNAVADGNQNGSKGGFDGPAQSFTLNANDQLETAQSYSDLVVAWRNGAPVRVRDVAHVVTAMENNETDVRFNGQSAVVLSIQREPGANIVATADVVKKALPALEKTLPGFGEAHPRQRPDDDHPRLRQRRAVHAAPQHPAGGAGDLPVPGLDPRHHHPRPRAAAVAHRHLRGDVFPRLRPRQPVADGADGRRRLRRRRRHRHDRERGALHRGRRAAAGGRL